MGAEGVVDLCRECMWPLLNGGCPMCRHAEIQSQLEPITDHDAGDEDAGQHKAGAD